MARQKIPQYSPEPMAPAIVISCLLLTILVLAAFVWSQVRPTSSDEWSEDQWREIQSGIEFPPHRIDRSTLEASRNAHYQEAELELIADEVNRLRSLIQAANRAQFLGEESDPPPDLQALDFELRYAAEEIIPVTGVRGFQRIGEPIFERCTRGVNALALALERDRIALADALENPPAEEFQEYRSNCGNFLPLLIERSLIRTNGHWNHPDHELLLDVLQRYRFADLVHSQYSTHHQLAPYELEIYHRWIIEDPDAFDLAERRRHLERARAQLPSDYDLPLAQARLDAADLTPTDAARRFRELAERHPGNDLYQAIADRLKDRQGAKDPNE